MCLVTNKELEEVSRMKLSSICFVMKSERHCRVLCWNLKTTVTDADVEEFVRGKWGAGMEKCQKAAFYFLYNLLFHHSLPCCEHELYLFSARE